MYGRNWKDHKVINEDAGIDNCTESIKVFFTTQNKTRFSCNSDFLIIQNSISLTIFKVFNNL